MSPQQPRPLPRTEPIRQAEPIRRAEPLREAVYARVVDLIVSGRCPPGAALTEAALSRDLQVSRTPIREALLRLESEGVLSSTLAKGFTVRPLVRREAAELYPILATLESLAVKSVCGVPATATLHRTLDELEGCTDPVRRWQLDTRWHNSLVAAAGNEHLMSFVARLRVNLSRYELTYMREAPSREVADHQHRMILTALAAGDLPQAVHLLETHWREGMEVVLDWLGHNDG